MNKFKDFFKKEDFEIRPDYNERAEAARIANAKLQQLIESSPVVYGRNSRMWATIRSMPGTNNGMTIEPETHKARLMFIEELPKESCEHRGQIIEYKFGNPTMPLRAKCTQCGVELVATWTEVKS